MNRVNALLLVALVACALGVVTSQHKSRKLFIELQAEQDLSRKLQEEYTQLTLEQGTWSTNKRVEKIASQSLGMKLPDAKSTVVLAPQESGAAK
jgi:cell division protein FtsL